MKGTKLWQAPGSPVIQGRSRNRRPFLNDWAVSAVAAAAAMFVATMLVAVFPGSGSVPLSPAVTTSLALLLYALPGVAVGALLGTAFARTIGSRRVWIGGCLGGFVLGAVSIAMLASDLTLRGITFT